MSGWNWKRRCLEIPERLMARATAHIVSGSWSMSRGDYAGAARSTQRGVILAALATTAAAVREALLPKPAVTKWLDEHEARARDVAGPEPVSMVDDPEWWN